MERDLKDAEILAQNLRVLCEKHGAISAICERMGINRQQFNKYLSGSHLPSNSNMRLIANYFGLSPAIMLSDPDEFKTLVDGNFFDAMMTAKNMKKLPGFMSDMFIGTSKNDERYVGVYDRYQFSSIYRGSILRSAFCIYRNNQFLQHYYVERFPSYDTPDKTEYIFKYHGLCFAIDTRLFTTDFEVIQRNEVTFGVYATVERSAKKMMFGIGSGIAANQFRQPYATKVALHYRGPGLIKKSHIRSATVLDRSDPSIPREVVQYLGEAGDMTYSQ
ncbi:helix-turn-helix transcriptional regulator [Methylobacterium sp. OT2]|uniref:helix-turn-helix domain-containing protein n=1 Tax=Methylobacterium sp. OT2 TaxID=2813779 RepID=UPI00197B1851|nr:helix-turn-helix transcriptional regulator [Methylobacterium sp. OT2]MBN4095988.1 helix-turn-helix transcriptional regulator [Methylobacterium sp. OT2]